MQRTAWKLVFYSKPHAKTIAFSKIAILWIFITAPSIEKHNHIFQGPFLPSSASHFLPCSGLKTKWFMDFRWQSVSSSRRHLAHPLPMPSVFVCGPAEQAGPCCAHGPAPASLPACLPGCFRYWVGTMGFKIHLFFFQQGSSRGDEGVVDAFFGLLPITWRSSRKPCTLPCREGPAVRRVPGRAGGHWQGDTGRGTRAGGRWLRVTGWGSLAGGHRSGPPPRRGLVSRQRGGPGRSPPWGASAGWGRGRARSRARRQRRSRPSPSIGRGPCRASPRCGAGRDPLQAAAVNPARMCRHISLPRCWPEPTTP